ncbi:MAG: tellurite resistance/C4-dicarboxylate transporter family protein [Actinomycetota bacterium]|nr:tellurite resistance/C4-dicarboxylate transporter family protein [Actinomycetota bacterium]
MPGLLAGGRAASGVHGLTPSYFAIVMATGIISLGLDLSGFTTLSAVLFMTGVISYVVLVMLNAWRLVVFHHAMRTDFIDPRRAFGFFTFVAGTNVLGVRAGEQGWHAVTAVLLVVAGLCWFVLGYVVPWSAVLGHAERPVLTSANGSWFVWVVASQSVAVAAASLEVVVTDGRTVLAIVAVFSWSVGVFLYAAVGVFVSLRLMLYRLEPVQLDPPYWVAMGAVAITVLAGARIVEMQSAPMVDATRALIAGMSVVFWCFATWLVPALIAAGIWRHAIKRVPLGYTPALWSIVFPLGMYAVASTYLGRADHLPIIEAIGAGWIWVALTAWAIVFAAMLRDIARQLGFRRPGRAGPSSTG